MLANDDWACSDAPGSFTLPDQRDELVARYAPPLRLHQPGPQTAPPQLDSILRYADELEADSVKVEAPYIDFDYRSEFSGLYARNYDPPPDKCERLLFFKGNEFLGFVVVRPSINPVGRTAILPPSSVSRFLTCKTEHVVRPHGVEYTVDAWPYLSQDGVYGRCAHAAIWQIARYHHLRHNGPRSSIAAVVEASGTQPGVDKTFRSNGLSLTEVANAFAGLGLPALPYAPDQLSNENLKAIVCRYLNSGFPVALSTPHHLTVLIGYGEQDGKLFFIRSDDNQEPYERVDDWADGQDRLGKWRMLLVPLPARIHVPCEMAEVHARLAFCEQAGATEDTEDTLVEFSQGKLLSRTYAIEAAEYKKMLADRDGLDAMIVRHHQRTPASSWIWVTEFQRRDENGPSRVVGEIALDATSHPHSPQPLFANMPGRVVAWFPGETDPRAKFVEQASLYKSNLEQRFGVDDVPTADAVAV